MATTTTTPLPDSTSPEAPGHDKLRGRLGISPRRPHLGRRRGRSRGGGPAVVTPAGGDDTNPMTGVDTGHPDTAGTVTPLGASEAWGVPHSEPLAPVNAARERMIGASIIEVRRINATDGKAGSSLCLRCGGRLGSQPEEGAR
jgi:hypothetical protein